jgi:hypothetical protein
MRYSTYGLSWATRAQPIVNVVERSIRPIALNRNYAQPSIMRMCRARRCWRARRAGRGTVGACA